MFVGPRSRFVLTNLILQSDGTMELSDREPFAYRQDPRNRMHRVLAGDTLWSLAEKFFPTIRDAANLWWLIADFQDPPILDPTVRLEPETLLVIPPESILMEVFSDARRGAETLA